MENRVWAAEKGELLGKSFPLTSLERRPKRDPSNIEHGQGRDGLMDGEQLHGNQHQHVDTPLKKIRTSWTGTILFRGGERRED